jgi:alpha-L-fucosidase
MIGLAPDRRGLLPDVDVQRLKEFGDAINSIYAPEKNLAARASNAPTYRTVIDSDPDTAWSPPMGSPTATIELTFSHPITFGRALTMEWLVEGQEVQKYAIQVMNGAKWKTIYSGTTIGHKKIDLFSPTTAQKVRLNILSASPTPRIRKFQLFDGTQAQ